MSEAWLPPAERRACVLLKDLGIVGVIARRRPGPKGEIFEVASAGRRIECGANELTPIDEAQMLALVDIGPAPSPDVP